MLLIWAHRYKAALFCFGAITPGPEFRGNLRERGPRSPATGFQGSDPPLGAHFAEAKHESRLCCSDFPQAKRQSRPQQSDFCKAKRESVPAGGLLQSKVQKQTVPLGLLPRKAGNCASQGLLPSKAGNCASQGLLPSKVQNRLCHWDFCEAKRETVPRRDFREAKRESVPAGDFCEAKRES